MDLIDIALVVVGVGYLLVRRVIGDIVELKRLLVLPVVLVAVGASQLTDIGGVDVATVAVIGASAALSVLLGVVRGATVHFGVRHGELWMRYRVVTVGLWVLNLALRALAYPLERAVSPAAADASNHALLFTLGLGVLAESAVVLLRALHRDGVVVWAKSADGRHTASPAFDRARQQVRAGGGQGLRDTVLTAKRDW